MTKVELDPRLRQELKDLATQGLASGDFLSPAQIAENHSRFRARFGPAALRNTDGEALLRLMHGREDLVDRSLAYWLEYKSDDEFRGTLFGGIGGGAATKFGIFQRAKDNTWVSASLTALTLEDAILVARQQRDELLAGDAALSEQQRGDTSDEAYARLQQKMEDAAPKLSQTAWAHKYWALLHADKLDDFHSPRYQRFHIFKMLQSPPDGSGIRDDATARFVCAGRFVNAARELDVPVNTLTSALVKRNGGRRHYWKVGTTADSGKGESQWPAMRDGGYVSIGWPDSLTDLSQFIGQTNAREQLRDRLLASYDNNARTAMRKAGEVMKFVQDIAEGDLVLACDGQNVLGVGRVRGPYEYDAQLRFPHTRPVDWLSLEPWHMPSSEGPQTTVFELGRYPDNLLKLEQHIFQRKPIAAAPAAAPSPAAAASASLAPPLDAFTARVEAILRRKGQAIFYGPPGTGKTYRALAAACELAAGRAFRKRYKGGDLTDAEKKEIDDPAGLVRVCTFHPGYGYEDFIEGFRPRTAGGGQMTFDLRDGIFKTLCEDARRRPDRHFFLIVDEINRGDIPRIFGELMTVVERDKRDMPITLPLSGAPFAVPPNVFIVGTMNTADRSISLLDTALRRRFGFVELMPDSEPLLGRKAGGIMLGPWLDALNARVRRHLKRDARNLQVGHAYLLPAQPITSMAEFARVLRDDIIPLLEEYCYEDFDALRGILGNDIVDAENGRIREEIFGPEREERLILALAFEEMQRAGVAEPAESPTGDDDDDDDATAA